MAWRSPDEFLYVKEILDQHDSIVFYDIETTGLSEKTSEIIEFGAVRYSLPDFEEIDSIDVFIKPSVMLDTKIVEITGITDAFLEENGVEEDEAFAQIQRFLDPMDLLVGHNIKLFDNKFMDVFYSKNDSVFEYGDMIDTLPLAKRLIHKSRVLVDGKPSYKEKKLYELYNGEDSYQFHLALNDSKACANIFRHMLKEIDKLVAENNEAMSVLNSGNSYRIISVSPFSKGTRKRVYVNTSNSGTYYYDVDDMNWDAKPGQGNIKGINMPDLRQRVLNLVGCESEKDLFKAAQKHYKCRVG